MSPEQLTRRGHRTVGAAHTSLSMADYLAMSVEERYEYSAVCGPLCDIFDEWVMNLVVFVITDCRIGAVIYYHPDSGIRAVNI